ncbi:nuclear transport factor 2 family protein [Polaribacter sp.]|uniref:nuclear transport factor 2 family protein n=1 Tax=Polaribacter sp. TaxID=1920175 RepID=UPI003F6D68BD
MPYFLAVFKSTFITKKLLTILLLVFSFVVSAQIDRNSNLYKTLKVKDSIIFNRGFNHCEVEKIESVIANNFEFYHDIVGIQNKTEFINAIKTNLCTKPGIFSRKLVINSLQVYSLKNNGKVYGAIQKGFHNFYRKENDKTRKTGTAQFTHLWILENKQWKLKRVLSFDHKDASIE